MSESFLSSPLLSPTLDPDHRIAANNPHLTVTSHLPISPRTVITSFLPSSSHSCPLSSSLSSPVSGVVDHGIFAGFTTAVIVAGKDGVRVAGAGGEKPWW
jgi:hypothetical protein